MKKNFLLLLATMLVFSSLWAQTLRVTGKVTDALSNETLIGATIVVEGTTGGVITDVNGNFTIDVSVGERLIISYIGYRSEQVVISDKTELFIALHPTTESLEEVVVVGYGTQKKESVVGAITSVGEVELANTGVSNITQSLSGKLSGVITYLNSGRPGEDEASILIRGRSSWVNSSPLVMVDGIERNFADIDPNEVESISVLKDASATAVYGTRGANGVILVTTKRGRESKPKINVTFMQGVKEATSLPGYVDAYTTMQLANVAMKNDGNFGGLYSQELMEKYRSGNQPYIYPDVDWIDEMFRLGTTTTANINLRGGTKFVKYFTSLGYNYEGDIMNSNIMGKLDPRFYSKRYNLRSNFDFDLTPTSRIRVNIGASHKIVNGNSGYYGDFFSNIYQLSVNYSPLFYGPDALELYPDADDPNAEGMRFALGEGSGANPYTVLHAGKILYDNDIHHMDNYRTYITDLNSDIGFDQDLSFITEGLKISALVSLNTTVGYNRVEKQQSTSYLLNENGTWRRAPNYDVDLEPLYFVSHRFDQNVRKLYYEAKVNYERIFNNHYVTAMGIFNRSIRDINDQPSFKQEAWSARVTYAYALKYLFEVNLGYSGSEQFAPVNRFGFFPAYAVGWNISEEKFIKDNIDFLSRLKIKYSYGKTGSDRTPGNVRWLYEDEGFTPTSIGQTVAVFGIVSGARTGSTYEQGRVANIYAQWEESEKQNLGFESGFFNNKLTFSVDFFKEDRDKILMSPGNVPYYAQVVFKELNLGRTKNHGYELELGYNSKKTSGVNYYVRSNFSFNENRVVFRDDPVDLPDYQKEAGFPIETQRQYLQDGLYQSVDDVVNYLYKDPSVIQGDVRFVDYNADGVIDDNDRVAYKGTSYPLYSYGVSLGGDFKGFNIHAVIQGMEGKNSYFFGTPSDPFYNSFDRIYSYQLDNYWTVKNPEALYPALHYNASLKAKNNNYSNTQRYVNTSFVRLKELQLSYSFKPDWVKFPVDYFMFYISGNNLLTFSENGEMGDPEKTSFSPGSRSTAYPLLRRYNIGLKANF